MEGVELQGRNTKECVKTSSVIVKPCTHQVVEAEQTRLQTRTLLQIFKRHFKQTFQKYSKNRSLDHLLVSATDCVEVCVDEDREEVECEATQLRLLAREECVDLVTHRLHVLEERIP